MSATRLKMRRADPGDPDVRPLIEAHLAHSTIHSPETSCHTMSVDRLREAGLQVWALFDGDQALGCGALKPLGDGQVEVKSVHVLEAARGRGLARVLMQRLIEIARADGHSEMVLETGSDRLTGYDAARGLYEALGFAYIDTVIADYAPDPCSAFMRLDLTV